ncbi:DNA-directed RNA polymerases I and III subunit RPAC1 [Orbilia oligospora]|uniref:DNA-directed RNA polymerases I and III subunit RPAC1 n=1 Tax=Orbilia oligospora TaxID=2813651 RepID=A0A6G1MD66_ORBOL|nr:DNA-directed RNA polymerases I and III subunit RPAC1 [Orbilia oligospora]KAF3205558.1 DNA-directed RNA polymerases I and III subunit RPAC1 [Orbilia oligospora]KAF3230661.1 DNA-directed RNA polymerases I and III subunit RPAC1 [Orbilia oligospora]KAF3254042.1 DNA-directed RNA polymerases I and III subunit RPAC1 [Orbilia oligospora]
MAPSKEELERRRIVGVELERVSNVTSTDFPGHYPGEDHSWNLDDFKKNSKIDIHKANDLHYEFDLIGVDASVANAFRRILISEVPTLAIETVFVHNNTSIVQDEVLAQRLGLVPLRGDKKGFQQLRWRKKSPDEPAAEATDFNTVVMTLKVACTRNHATPNTETDPSKLYFNSSVYARDIKFAPQGRQSSWFSGAGEIRPVNPDILLAKLRPGQEIDLEIHCVLGIGQDHAKFSPVATASYRLLPSIKIKKPITGEDAEKFVNCFPKGVAEVQKDKKTGEKTAVVVNPRKDTVSREVLRHDEFKGKVELGRIRDHFIFSIESTGMYNSDELFLQAVQILKKKCTDFQEKLMES